MRYKLTIEYDGSAFYGWQAQEGFVTAQSVLEEAVARFSRGQSPVFGAGRTDRGVHASGQVAHVDFEKIYSTEQVRRGLNACLLKNGCTAMSVLSVEEAPDTFHARFSATSRAYLYRLSTRPSPLALDARRAWWAPWSLDFEAMHAATSVLTGTHDFSKFRSSHCQAASAVRTVDVLEVLKVAEGMEIRVQARSFLHQQVRRMVGALVFVGRGLWTAETLTAYRDQVPLHQTPNTAPGHGLFLTHVEYDAESLA